MSGVKMNCKNAEEMILTDKTDFLLDEHLKSCAACAAYKKDYEKIRQIHKRFRENNGLTVPASLDLSVKAAARNRNMSARLSFREKRKMWYAWISSQAAVFAVCFVIWHISSGTSAVSHGNKNDNPLALTQNFADENENDLSSSDFYSEVAELSFDLEYSTNGNSFDYNDLVLTQLNSNMWGGN